MTTAGIFTCKRTDVTNNITDGSKFGKTSDIILHDKMEFVATH